VHVIKCPHYGNIKEKAMKLHEELKGKMFMGENTHGF